MYFVPEPHPAMRLLSLLLILLVCLLAVDARARFASGDLYIASESLDGVPLEAPSLFDASFSSN
ncbi:hypothetical protein PRIPAC_74383 [Pristionchus pacificus]|uniref:Uncharacterized protein n=1 Tax=Pristionchus pacificus TaxID=54126 RepID=A0A2A6C8A3_PRIPA|nr:hypothetical protein PRIPAC_74383 [Pristionchus pacificus]|eukprot:PDM74283.1 hypothetical protein PRIPAC_41639 [Pristionchus pacificus]